MKKILIFLIKLYQKIPGTFHNLCRHIPTCSNYAIEAIEKYGSFKGTYLSIKRILKCNPLGTKGYDPVPVLNKEKNMKKILLITISILIIFSTTGCLKQDKMDDINIATTIYPIEYVTTKLYGENSTIKSIYPRSANTEKYNITDKQLKDYSKYDLFIYNGESKEKEYATVMQNNNRNLKIIDASNGIDISYKTSDIWLNPSNILMLGQNIKNEIKAYMSNKYSIEKLEEKYNLLKVDITELETELKRTADNSLNNTIVVADESLNFLEKYGFKIVNLTDKGKVKENNVEMAKKLFSSNGLDYIFILDHSPKYDITSELQEISKVKTLTFRTLDSITENDEKNNDDYLSIMHNNIDLLKEETYK